MSNDPGILAMANYHRKAAEFVLPETMGAFFKERAETLGDTLAASFIDDGEEISYCELYEQSSKLASSLVKFGVRKGTHVGLMIPNSRAYLVSWLSVALIGAVLIPINKDYTSTEMEFVLNDSDSQFLIIEESLSGKIRDFSKMPRLLDADRIIVSGDSNDRYSNLGALIQDGSSNFVAPSRLAATDLMTLQYTSGTTGFPKGCMLTHEYWLLLGNIVSMRGLLDVPPKRSLIWAPFSYMDPQWQFLASSLNGGTSYIVRKMSITKYWDWLVDNKIEYCDLPELFLERYPASEKDAQIKLKHISAYGWPKEMTDEVEERFGLHARNAFGMTEIGAGIFVPIEAHDMARTWTCGLPGPFREARIVGDDGQDVAQGETGELWVRGRAILQGYYHRPEANAASFVGDWFRTGDLMYQDEKGYFYFVSRIKDMIRRSGENIASAEVEYALAALPGIAEAAVIPVPDSLRGEEVKAFIVLDSGTSKDDLDPVTIIAHCGSHLAPFKVPRYIKYVDALPQTTSEKIAKGQLKDHDSPEGTYDRQVEGWL